MLIESSEKAEWFSLLLNHVKASHMPNHPSFTRAFSPSRLLPQCRITPHASDATQRHDTPCARKSHPASACVCVCVTLRCSHSDIIATQHQPSLTRLRQRAAHSWRKSRAKRTFFLQPSPPVVKVPRAFQGLFSRLEFKRLDSLLEVWYWVNQTTIKRHLLEWFRDFRSVWKKN